MKKLNYNKAKKFYNKAKEYIKRFGCPINIPKEIWEFEFIVEIFKEKFDRTPNVDEYELILSLFSKEEQAQIIKFSYLISEIINKE